MFEGLVSDLEIIFGLLTIPKCELIEVEIPKFQGLAWQFQLIFGHWTNPKCELDEVKNDISRGWKALRTHFLPLDQPKMRFG